MHFLQHEYEIKGISKGIAVSTEGGREKHQGHQI
jgi:hypothetical protein